MLQNSQFQLQDLELPMSLKEYIEKGPKIVEKLKKYKFDTDKYKLFSSNGFSLIRFIKEEHEKLESHETLKFEL